MKKVFVLALAVMMFPAVVFSQAGHPKVIAHRGYWNCEQGGFTNNSVASLTAAHGAGIWGAEFDVNMTSDEVLLVYHDSSIKGKRIDSNPYSEFADVKLENGEPIPVLDEYLRHACECPDMVLVLELKGHSTDGIERRAVELCIEKLKSTACSDRKRSCSSLSV